MFRVDFELNPDDPDDCVEWRISNTDNPHDIVIGTVCDGIGFDDLVSEIKIAIYGYRRRHRLDNDEQV
jgi:hypothetical protein